MTDVNHKKSDVLSDARCPRDSSGDLEATEYSNYDYKLRCKNCGWEWTESWRPSMANEGKLSPR
jgi:hypothetical protein